MSHHIFTVYVFSSDAGAAVYYPPPTSATSLNATSVNSVTFFLTRSQEHQDSSIWSLLKYLRMEDDTFLVTSSLGVMGNIIEIGETLQQSVSQRCAHFAICMTFCHKHVFAVYSISHRVNLFLFLSWFPLSWWWYSKSAQPPWQNSTLQSSQTLTKKYQATFKVLIYNFIPCQKITKPRCSTNPIESFYNTTLALARTFHLRSNNFVSKKSFINHLCSLGSLVFQGK